uniref:Major facilitator superfamily (MFS) profile domain-containing protein n=1 Tax=Photinus pyralis TaxID=7054 RepID=A0A1Y1NGZ6_PHOPY
MKLLNFPLEKRALQYTAVFACSVATFSSGCQYGWSSPYLPLLLSEDSPIPMTNEQSSWVVVICLFGGLCGAICAGITLDLIGRKMAILISSVTFIVSWLMMAFANSLAVLLAARLIAGYSDGLIYGVIPVYIAEISDAGVRGLLGCTVTITFLIGSAFMNVIGTYLTIKWSALICAALPVIILVLLIWIPDSPNFYLIKNNHEKARVSLVAFKGVEEADRTLEILAESVTKGNLRCLFKKPSLKNLLMIMGLRFGQQFSGVIAFTFYAQTLFQEGSDALSPLSGVLIWYAVQILFSTIGALYVDRIGRKPLMIASTIGSVISLLLGGLFFLARDVLGLDTSGISALPTVMLITYIISYSSALQLVPLFLGAEIFASNVKAYSVAISDGYYFIFAGLASKYFQFTMEEYGLYVPFLTFALCCSFGLVMIIFFIPETKNKTLEEIQMEMNNKSSA